MKKAIAVLLSILIIANVFAFSASATVYNYTSMTRLANIPSESYNGSSCGSAGGMSISSGNTVFAIKANSTDTVAALYYFPNIITYPSTRYLFWLLNVGGHANSMTISNNNLYITGWVHNTNNGNTVQSGNTNNNWIVKIPISVITSLSNGATIPQKSGSQNGYSIIYPMEATSTGYTSYTHPINAITMHNSPDSFIINFPDRELILDGGTPLSNKIYDFWYTKATLGTDGNGNEILIVSKNTSDIFVIKNNLSFNNTGTYQYSNLHNQDVFSSYGNGLFAARYFGGSRKNVIVWTNVNNPPQGTKTVGNYSYSYFTPDKININATNEKFNYNGSQENIYDTFEIESLSYRNSNGNELICSCNISYTSNYISYFHNQYNTSSNPPADGIYSITF